VKIVFFKAPGEVIIRRGCPLLDYKQAAQGIITFTDQIISS
jgi:hypothetical protein